MLPEEGLEEIENLLLLFARQLGDGFKDLAGFADRPVAAGLGPGLAEQLFDAQVERRGDGGELIGAQRDFVALPIGDGE